MKIFKIGKPNKASLSLSLNAIVILILAVAMLGLGLAFIRGIFKNISGKVDEAISVADLINPPTRDTPLTLTPSSIDIRQGKNAEVKIAFLNSLSDSNNCQLQIPALTPDYSLVTGKENPAILSASGCYSMNKDQVNQWTLSLDAKSATAGTYINTVKISCFDKANTACAASFPSAPAKTDFTKDLVITITS